MQPFRAGVIGHPIEHSLSPEIFTWLSQRLKKKIIYQKLPLLPEALLAFLRTLKELPLLDAWNVTLPHKEKLAQWLSEDPRGKLSDEARMIGAVNVVKRYLDQSNETYLKGFNTDSLALIKLLKEYCRSFLGQENLLGQEVLVFGAGGAALATAYALGKLNTHLVWLSNRDEKRAQSLLQKFSSIFPKTKWQVIAWESLEEFNRPMAAYIQTSSLGMSSQAGCVPLPLRLNPKSLAFDLVYCPDETEFLKRCKDKNLHIIKGVDMLIEQAIATWQLWFDEITELDFKQELKSFIQGKLQ